jgi:hypothetical protein
MGDGRVARTGALYGIAGTLLHRPGETSLSGYVRIRAGSAPFRYASRVPLVAQETSAELVRALDAQATFLNELQTESAKRWPEVYSVWGLLIETSEPGEPNICETP